MNILFMCVANSARSQMAEGLARKMLGQAANVESAGSSPTSVNPFAVKAMNEVGIDISGNRSKTFDQLNIGFIAGLTFIITLCAEEVCPRVASKAKKLHWPLTDPAGKGGDDETQLARFRVARDTIAAKIREFAKEAELPLAE